MEKRTRLVILAGIAIGCIAWSYDIVRFGPNTLLFMLAGNFLIPLISVIVLSILGRSRKEFWIIPLIGLLATLTPMSIFVGLPAIAALQYAILAMLLRSRWDVYLGWILFAVLLASGMGVPLHLGDTGDTLAYITVAVVIAAICCISAVRVRYLSAKKAT